MSGMAKKMRYAGLNLIAPGIGQLAMKKWIRGSLQLLGAVVCIVWMIAALVNVMIGNIYLVLDGKEPDAHILDVFIPMGVLALIWIYSYIDLFFFCSVAKTSEKKDADSYQI